MSIAASFSRGFIAVFLLLFLKASMESQDCGDFVGEEIVPSEVLTSCFPDHAVPQ